jgi:hypothetical protein
MNTSFTVIILCGQRWHNNHRCERSGPRTRFMRLARQNPPFPHYSHSTAVVAIEQACTLASCPTLYSVPENANASIGAREEQTTHDFQEPQMCCMGCFVARIYALVAFFYTCAQSRSITITTSCGGTSASNLPTKLPRSSLAHRSRTMQRCSIGIPSSSQLKLARSGVPAFLLNARAAIESFASGLRQICMLMFIHGGPGLTGGGGPIVDDERCRLPTAPVVTCGGSVVEAPAGQCTSGHW